MDNIYKQYADDCLKNVGKIDTSRIVVADSGDVYKRQGEILLLSGLTDLADGYIARRFHRISNLGKIFN